ncbi:MAG: helix-turn-helix domain-containing protein, partial [Chloroflexi bacterium]|nr:helix-turn-helix domain-containing protein [Chloroflexota bacterium]
MAETTPTFGRLLRQFRVRAGLSQEALAESAGISASAIAAIEQGVRQRPHPHTTTALAEALGLAADERTALLSLTTPARPTAPSPPAPVGSP